MKIPAVLLLFCFPVLLLAQHLPVKRGPEIIHPLNQVNSQLNRQPGNPHVPNIPSHPNAQNMQMFEEDMYQIEQEINRQKTILTLEKNGFPSLSGEEGASNYYEAFEEINRMLTGEKDLDLARTIFLIENAWHGNTYDYEEYKKTLQYKAELCRLKAKQDNLDISDNMVKNMMIFRLLTDTLEIKTQEGTLTHYPIKYNYDDYDSTQSFDSHFVTTLMQTGAGQCHSMPLYYLLLAEELEAEAYWALSPKHTYVKIKDEKGIWYNIELTCAGFLSDTHYINNSFMKSESLQNRIYMEPMDKKNVIAELLTELSSGYYIKYGLDDFYLKCADTAIKQLDYPISPYIQKAAYQTRLTLTLAHLYDAPKPDLLKEKSSIAYSHYEKMIELYATIDNLGYEEVPEDLYQDWLEYIAKEKERQQKRPDVFLKLPKKE